MSVDKHDVASMLWVFSKSLGFNRANVVFFTLHITLQIIFAHDDIDAVIAVIRRNLGLVSE